MYAVIKTGGKQYRVQPDDVIEIERLPGEAGDMIEFSEVLLVAGDNGVEVGTPMISGATVAGELVEQTRGDKIIIFKKKRRKHYRRKQGHRQDLSEVRITEILTGGAKPSKKAAAKKPAKKKAADVPPPVSADTAAGPMEAPTAAEAQQAKPAAKKAEKPVKAAAGAGELTQIAGVGPAIAGKLEGLGYTTLQQIADLTPEQVDRIGEELKFKGRIEREEWIEQARDLVAGKPPRAKSDKKD